MKRKNRKSFFRGLKGKAELPLLAAIIAFSIFLAGGLLSTYKPGLYPFQSLKPASICCDSGNGESCRPIESNAFDFIKEDGTTVRYGLLRSRAKLQEGGNHLRDTGQRHNGGAILLNISDGYRQADGSVECGLGVNDQMWDPNGRGGTGVDGTGCVPYPNDQMVYVCRENCPAQDSQCLVGGPNGANTTCFGGRDTVYDIYFRIADFPNPGVPPTIKNCAITGSQGDPVEGFAQQKLLPPSIYPSHQSLQLHTFGFASPTPALGESSFVSPYCKPAVYLYPPKEESVHVAIEPKGEITLTIPEYPQKGWDVIADPTGNIRYKNETYDYLFYEAKIPDTLIPSQNTGYVIAYSKLEEFFGNLLPYLGLNEKEEKQFSAYWLAALPESPFYRIAVIPEETLDAISPLTIVPNPTTVIRVTLQFTPLDKEIVIAPPILPEVKRKGFTVVEWGGLFKQDKNHPFTCLM